MKWIVFSILALAVLLMAMMFFLSVSTRQGAAPGLANGVLTRCPATPNCVCSEPGNDDEHSIGAITGSQIDMTKIADAIRSLGGVVVDETPGYLSARFVSGVFRFVDDVEVRAADDGVFHVRSASRAGKSDLGVNRKRVEALRAALGT